jgi:hypothetical protein
MRGFIPALRFTSASVRGRSPRPPGMRSVWRDGCSPPVWPPPSLIEAPRRHQGWPVWIDPVVFRAITISWNNIIIPGSWPYHGHLDNNPSWFMNDFCLPRPGFSTRRPEITHYQGRSESARDSHYLHVSASLPESAKGLKARQANSFSTGLNDGLWRETVMAAESPDVCCPGQGGRHLLGMGISHFDPYATSRVELAAVRKLRRRSQGCPKMVLIISRIRSSGVPGGKKPRYFPDRSTM